QLHARCGNPRGKTAFGFRGRKRARQDHVEGRCGSISERLVHLSAQGNEQHRREQRPGTGSEPIWTQQGLAARTCHRRDKPSLRSLRPDGGISAHEQHHSPGEPAAEVVRFGYFPTVSGTRREGSRLFYFCPETARCSVTAARV